jgi:hypothetical protein
MKLTMPQLIMLNHAAWVNRENADRSYEAKHRRSKPEDMIWQQEQQKVETMDGKELSMYLTQPFGI